MDTAIYWSGFFQDSPQRADGIHVHVAGSHLDHFHVFKTWAESIESLQPFVNLTRERINSRYRNTIHYDIVAPVISVLLAEFNQGLLFGNHTGNDNRDYSHYFRGRLDRWSCIVIGNDRRKSEVKYPSRIHIPYEYNIQQNTDSEGRNRIYGQTQITQLYQFLYPSPDVICYVPKREKMEKAMREGR